MSTWSAHHRFGPWTLAALIHRARRRCTWCARRVQQRQYAIDHVVPRSRGGSDDPSNLVLACKDCNLARGAHPRISEALRARMAARGRTPRQAWREVRRQTAIPVGRGTGANREAWALAWAWFGSALNKDLAYHRAYRARGGAIQRPEIPF